VFVNERFVNAQRGVADKIWPQGGNVVAENMACAPCVGV